MAWRGVAWHGMARHASLQAPHAGAREGKLRGGSVALFAAVAAFILGVVVALFLAPRV
jgi:membrane associated rhomboid family serine protease